MKLDLQHLKQSLSTISVYLTPGQDLHSATQDMITAFNHLPVSLFLFDDEGRILFYNATFSKLVGLDTLDSTEPIQHIQDLPFYLNELKSVINHVILDTSKEERPALERQAVTLQFPKGDVERSIGFSIRSEAIHRSGSTGRVWVIVASDISRYKKIDPEEEKRLESIRRSQQFIAITRQIGTFSFQVFKHLFAVSQYKYLLHEENNLMIQRLQQATPLTAEEQQSLLKQVQKSQDYLQRIEGSIREAHQLFKNLKQLNQPILLKLAPVNLNISLCYWIRDWQREVSLPEGSQITVDTDLNVPKIHADFHEIKRALKAILQNSIDFRSPQDLLQIKIYLGLESRETTTYVTINVVDNGIGIPMELQESLFDPFFTTKPNQLLGLGLPYSFKLLDAHHGQLGVDSHIGLGTHVVLRFPPLESTSPSGH
jgi:signal transduction histidine kinase